MRVGLRSFDNWNVFLWLFLDRSNLFYGWFGDLTLILRDGWRFGGIHLSVTDVSWGSRLKSNQKIYSYIIFTSIRV